MPCSKGMVGCKRSCLHRMAIEQGYRPWREYLEQERERVTNGWATEMAEYGPLPQLKDWLIASRGANAAEVEAGGGAAA